MKAPLHAAIALILAACTTIATANVDGSIDVGLNQQADLGGPRVTVLRLIEDSRCPVEADCIWAGRVKVRVRVELGSGTRLHDLATDQSVGIADGVLELTRVLPARSSQRVIAPEDYRFALKFSGGL